MSEKLQKVLANLGLGSRRVMETWISEGRIKVNGVLATLGDRVEEDDRLFVDGRPITQKKARHRYLLYNKPAEEICTRDDPEGRNTVFQRLPKLKKQRWIAVGRLDYMTTGLMLFTTDGELANKLMHPATEIDREYAVRVLGDVTDDQLQIMLNGVVLEDGIAKFTDIQKGRDEDGANQWYYCVVMEGRNREVRRLWESQGFTVSRLKRVRYGSFFIPSAVKAGKYIDLKPKDIRLLYEMAGMKRLDRPRAQAGDYAGARSSRRSTEDAADRFSGSASGRTSDRTSEGSSERTSGRTSGRSSSRNNQPSSAASKRSSARTSGRASGGDSDRSADRSSGGATSSSRSSSRGSARGTAGNSSPNRGPARTSNRSSKRSGGQPGGRSGGGRRSPGKP